MPNPKTEEHARAEESLFELQASSHGIIFGAVLSAFGKIDLVILTCNLNRS